MEGFSHNKTLVRVIRLTVETNILTSKSTLVPASLRVTSHTRHSSLRRNYLITADCHISRECPYIFNQLRSWYNANIARELVHMHVRPRFFPSDYLTYLTIWSALKNGCSRKTVRSSPLVLASVHHLGRYSNTLLVSLNNRIMVRNAAIAKVVNRDQGTPLAITPRSDSGTDITYIEWAQWAESEQSSVADKIPRSRLSSGTVWEGRPLWVRCID